MKNKYVIIGKLIALILLLSATYMATVSIPKINGEIQKQNAEINRTKEIEIASIHLMLNIANLLTMNNFAILEHNLVSYLKLGKEQENRVIQNIIDIYKTITIDYKLLLPDSTISAIYHNVNNQFETIIADKNLSMQEKLKHATQIMKAAKNEAGNKHNENVQAARNYRSKKESLEKSLAGQYSFFVLLQIIGLILFGFVDIIEKLVTNMKT